MILINKNLFRITCNGIWITWANTFSFTRTYTRDKKIIEDSIYTISICTFMCKVASQITRRHITWNIVSLCLLKLFSHVNDSRDLTMWIEEERKRKGFGYSMRVLPMCLSVPTNGTFGTSKCLLARIVSLALLAFASKLTVVKEAWKSRNNQVLVVVVGASYSGLYLLYAYTRRRDSFLLLLSGDVPREPHSFIYEFSGTIPYSNGCLCL